MEKALVFAKYEGDIDRWQREGTPSDKAAIDVGDWSAMEMIVDELSISKARVTSHGSGNAPAVRTYTVMSEDEIRKAHRDTERFRSDIVAGSYDEVISVLWPIAR